MAQSRVRILGTLLACLAALAALPSGAVALGMSDDYPRSIAAIGTHDGVRLTKMQVKVRPAGKRVRVTVRLAGASTGGPRRMLLSAAACTVRPGRYEQYEAPDAPSRPTCRPAPTASLRFAITETPFLLTKTLTIPRPATTPGALRVRVSSTTSTEPPPSCLAGANRFGKRAEFCRQFPETGDILLNGNAWKHMPGTWWGISATPPAGIVFDRIGYNSRTTGWVATSATAVNVATTQGFLGEPAKKNWSTPLVAGIQDVMRTSSAFGGESLIRPDVRVLDYAASVNGKRLFTMTLPLPQWLGGPRR